MKPQARSSFPMAIAIGLIVGLSGCYSPPSAPTLAVYGKISLPADVCSIGLTVSQPAPEFSLAAPESRADGASSAAVDGARSVASDPHGAFLFPVGFVVGGIAGSLAGVSASEIAKSTEAISAAVTVWHIDEQLARAVAQHVNGLQPGLARVLEANIPAERPVTPGHMRKAANGRLIWTRPMAAPHPLLGTGIDTVICLRVASLGLEPQLNPRVRSTGDFTSFNPPLAIVLVVDVTVVRVRDWAELGSLTVHYQSLSHKFTEWAAGNAAPLRQELATSFATTLAQITQQMQREPQLLTLN